MYFDALMTSCSLFLKESSVILSCLERRESGGASICKHPHLSRAKRNGSFERRKKTHLGLTSLGFPRASDPLPLPTIPRSRWQRASPARQQDPA
ncbi:hypothetical protein AVEN_200778-1 [Araneus ventricosus]|uniref:Uncharacterized protein n=1 Tax=Araneus ventricosus TaxID=182803 RepID=A0A4Y2DW12_ARAVE|nr:hypothetical protein AVEN_200778-1 [Araneus ventricosus]